MDVQWWRSDRAKLMTHTLRKLWQLSGTPLDSAAPEWHGYFDPVGLILHGQLANNRLWDAPSNSVTFASTGGDSVHYDLLDVGDGITDDSPVVMTVPFSDTLHTVVGENLLEFLRLGCCAGYFTLEELAYEPSSHLAVLDSHQRDPEASELQINLLRSIREHFSIEPWPSHATRLADLADRYLHFVVAEIDPY